MDGKVALITGSAGGIGKACAEALLKKGAKVCLSDVNAEAGKKTLEELSSKYGAASVIFLVCDVTKKEDMQRVFSETKKTFGSIDIVCNNAGIVHESNWDLAVDINVKGVIHGTLLALKYMGKDSGGKGGVIVNTASTCGLFPWDIGPVYAATKHAIVGFTRSYGSDVNFSRYGVRVNCLCPSAVDTNMHQNIQERLLRYDLYLEMREKLTLVPPETVAEVFLQFVEDETKNGEAAVIKFGKETEFKQPPAFEL